MTEEKASKAAAEDVEDVDGVAEEKKEGTKKGFFSSEKFDNLPLSDNMRTALRTLKFTMQTKIQVGVSGGGSVICRVGKSCFRVMSMYFCCAAVMLTVSTVSFSISRRVRPIQPVEMMLGIGNRSM